MYLNRQSYLAESILQELLFRNRVMEEGKRQKTMLALLFYHMNGMDEGLGTIKELHACSGGNLRIRLCPDHSILEYYDKIDLASKAGTDDWISLDEAEQQISRIDYVYIPILPFSVVSDLLHFNDRHREIRLLLWALMSGKKVSAYTAGADPYHPIWKNAGMDRGTSFLKHDMQGQLQKLKSIGIDLLNHHHELSYYINSAVISGSKQLITAETIQQYADAGEQRIDVRHGAIITPLARDVAREYDIEINEKRAGAIYGNGNRSWKSNSNEKR
ncbi:hypothetical protein ACFSCZ_08420 [Siminovitchia sediminis]|uniref:Uncharacterized protein n=1 Tax=Siminovitchia sediminis TaxID=1274353 RepID=A0ABW4KHD7_9BACI